LNLSVLGKLLDWISSPILKAPFGKAFLGSNKTPLSAFYHETQTMVLKKIVAMHEFV